MENCVCKRHWPDPGWKWGCDQSFFHHTAWVNKTLLCIIFKTEGQTNLPLNTSNMPASPWHSIPTEVLGALKDILNTKLSHMILWRTLMSDSVTLINCKQAASICSSMGSHSVPSPKPLDGSVISSLEASIMGCCCLSSERTKCLSEWRHATLSLWWSVGPAGSANQKAKGPLLQNGAPSA